jgi:NAD(P)-dependent dehydrogenase (short-subunit alcohol dehydrogenase family)
MTPDMIPDKIPLAALVTGGTQTPGLAIARALADAGFEVAVQASPNADEDAPAEFALLEADLTDEAQTSGLVARAVSAIGPLGVLVNAASMLRRDSWDDAARATWDMHIETNLRAPYVLIQQFAKALPPSCEGVVVNLLDQRINPHLVSYTLSKAALWTLTQTMALALAPRIRVNGIAPGPALKPSRDWTAAVDGTSPEQDVARAVMAILALRSMTGQMIVPDGVPRQNPPKHPSDQGEA